MEPIIKGNEILIPMETTQVYYNGGKGAPIGIVNKDFWHLIDKLGWGAGRVQQFDIRPVRRISERLTYEEYRELMREIRHYYNELHEHFEKKQFWEAHHQYTEDSRPAILWDIIALGKVVYGAVMGEIEFAVVYLDTPLLFMDAMKHWN